MGILCENRPEWAIADYGCLTARLASVPLYPTLPAEQLPHIINDSGATAVFVSTAAQAAKVARVRAECPQLRHVIGVDAGAGDGCDLTMAELEARGAALLYLPPYSPDLNPIEQVFSKLKAMLRRASARSVEALWTAIRDLLGAFTPAECGNYLADCGYRHPC